MKWFSNLKIRTKMIASFFVIIALMIGLAVFAAITARGVDDQNNYVIDFPNEREIALLEFQRSMRDLRRVTATITMYAPMGDETLITPLVTAGETTYNDSIAAIEHYYDVVDTDPKFTKDDKDSRKAAADGIKATITQYKTDIFEIIADHAKKGNYDEAIAVVKAGGTLISGIEETTTTLLNNTSKTAEEAATAATEYAGQSVTIIIIVAAIATVFAIVIALFVASLISKPLNRLTTLVSDVINGNLNINMNRAGASKDEVGVLTLDIYSLVDMIKNMIDDLVKLADELNTQGDIDYRMETSAYKGSYKEMLDGVNALVGAFIDDVLEVLRGISEVGKGNFDIKTKPLPGKKVVINDNFDKLTAALKSIYGDMTNLVNSAAQGKLDVRVDAKKFTGGWGEILANLNNLMEAIVNPINEVNSVMSLVAVGDFSLNMKGNYQGDFLKIKNSINNTIANLETYINEISTVLGALSNDDLDQDIKREYVGKFSDIKEALLNIIHKFNGVIGEIYAAAEQVTAGAKQVSESSMTLAQGATEQASSVEELSATIQTINENTAQNAGSAKEAEHLSDSSKTNAAKGNDNMQHMLKSMDGIKESSNDISKIIKVIEDIAFQTNLLALNAAVEAARAGEHGKGFAVVAEEVRSLASRSQTSAKDTSALIEESINRVNEGAKIAGETATALQAIVSDVTKVAGIITDIAKSSGEQSLAINQVMEGVNQISTVVQSNSATSEESASASQELSSQADVMKGLVEVFKLKKTR